MRIAGIICEYNPVHSGHVHHLRETRRRSRADLIVCLMSGEFMQRGEPAVCDKWTRAEMAVDAGADIVLELPFLYAVRSAEHFALGAVRILSSIGARILSFGAECSDTARLLQAARLLNDESNEFRARMHTALNQGQSYAAARRIAAAAYGPWLPDLLAHPNNVLAVEYLRADQRLGSGLEPLAVARLGSGHDQPWRPGNHPSSAAVRDALTAQPAASDAILHAAGVPRSFVPASWQERLFTLVSAQLRSASSERLETLPDIEPGLARRLIDAGRTASSFSALVDSAATRRYPPSRIRRLLLYTLLGITRNLTDSADNGGFPAYAHVLAVRSDRLEEFGQMCAAAKVPVAASPKYLPDSPLLEKDIASSDIYGLLSTPVRRAGADFTAPFAAVAPQAQSLP